jgi:hypothetical protein
MTDGSRPIGCPDHIDAEIWSDDHWPDDEPFPLTAEECLWLLRGYAVRPRSGPITVGVFDRLPWKIELLGGRLVPS